MIGLDTNVLARFLMQDDPVQGQAAEAVIADLTEADPGFVCREVLVELVWVMERAYKLPRASVATAITGLLEARELVLEAEDRVAIAVDRYRRGGPGFADQMVSLAGQAAGCEVTMTFDRKASKLPEMQLVSASAGQ